MSQLLDDLYEGKLSPAEEPESEEYGALADEADCLRALLEKEAPPAVRERLCAYIAAAREMEHCSAREAFARGFRLAVRLLLAAP